MTRPLTPAELDAVEKAKAWFGSTVGDALYGALRLAGADPSVSSYAAGFLAGQAAGRERALQECLAIVKKYERSGDYTNWNDMIEQDIRALLSAAKDPSMWTQMLVCSNCYAMKSVGHLAEAKP